MAYALRRVARYGDCDALSNQLDGVEAPPWPAIRAAIAALRASPISEVFLAGRGAGDGGEVESKMEKGGGDES